MSTQHIFVQTLDEVPDLLALHERQPQRYPFLLESLAHGGKLSRYDILFALPQQRLTLYADGRLAGDVIPRSGGDFLAVFDQWFTAENCALEPTANLPFTGGWFVYLGYELAQTIEPRLHLPHSSDANRIVATAVRIPGAVIVDRHQQTAWLVGETADVLATLQADLKQILPPLQDSNVLVTDGAHEDDPQHFLDAVLRIKEYIQAGDVFQVNLSRLWQGGLAPDVDVTMLYRRLRKANPAPFAGIARWDDFCIMSSSPERLVRLTGDLLDTRPIAGTRPRHADREQDIASWQALLQHPKERAEHIMLIDLERNDLGRIAVTGSVKVTEQMVLESYQHVHHIVSNVQARKRPDILPGEVIRALFPGGTITGCPKVRCMEIIAELERTPRGPYTGSFGYVNRSGDMDFNILIRTLWTYGRQWFVRAGAGIVADSIPEAELEETRAKARGVLAAMGITA